MSGNQNTPEPKVFPRLIVTATATDVTGKEGPFTGDSDGNLKVRPVINGNYQTGRAPTADGVSGTSQFAQDTIAFLMGFNETTYDRWRNNTELTILASAARTATLNSSDQVNYNHKGLHLIIDVTAISATPSVVPKIQGKDPVSAGYYDILEGVAIVATGTTILKVYPGITGSANISANDILPRTWRVNMTHADADSITYSIGAVMVL